MTTMRMAEILTNCRNKDDLPWDQFFTYLRTFEHDRIALITRAMTRHEIPDDTPIVIADDGEVLDGHHRLCVLQSWGYLEVEVEIQTAEDDAA